MYDSEIICHSHEGGNPWFDRLTMTLCHPELVEGLDPPVKPEDDKTVHYGQTIITNGRADATFGLSSSRYIFLIY
jgi:hypothetical protein